MASTDEVRNQLATRRHGGEMRVPEEGDDLRRVIDRQAAELELVLPAGLAPDRFARLILTAVKSQPKLLLAFGTSQGRQSVLFAAMEAATVGLEPNTPLQHAWLVPRRGRRAEGDQIWEGPPVARLPGSAGPGAPRRRRCAGARRGRLRTRRLHVGPGARPRHAHAPAGAR